MNVPLLRKVQNAILAEPKKFSMRMWFIEYDQSPCGTTACIAGHAIAIHRGWKRIKTGLKMNFDYAVSAGDIAAKVLGIEYGDNNEPGDLLFHLAYWPQPFQDQYRRARSHRDRARAASRRIDHFIKTEGRE